MKWLLVVVLAMGTFAQSAEAQTCPTGHVCFTQQAANEIFDKLNQLVASKDLNIKLLAERGTADAALANALKVIEGWKQMDEVNGQIILKKDQILALYERVIEVQSRIIDNLEKRLLRGKSAWQKFVAVVEKIGVLLAGIALGGAL